MPIYTDTLTVPRGTSSDDPVETTISINEWVVEGFDVVFPSGCAGLVHIIIMYGSEQIAPKPLGATLTGNNETVTWSEMWNTPEKPCTLRFLGWAPNTNYDHTLILRVRTLPKEVRKEREETKKTMGLIDKFIKLIGGIK